ncbi:hypothetical protein [Sodalis glossinidius]|uniref:hypothetical protein n=1 Tax=Sodalis glossinidius TaxID=63612 RepID=UPI0011D0D2B5|nr:hypothetical protein [Sodalis glossinidius]
MAGTAGHCKTLKQQEHDRQRLDAWRQEQQATLRRFALRSQGDFIGCLRDGRRPFWQLMGYCKRILVGLRLLQP